MWLVCQSSLPGAHIRPQGFPPLPSFSLFRLRNVQMHRPSWNWITICQHTKEKKRSTFLQMLTVRLGSLHSIWHWNLHTIYKILYLGLTYPPPRILSIIMKIIFFEMLLLNAKDDEWFDPDEKVSSTAALDFFGCEVILGAAANYSTKVYNCAHFWTPAYFRPRIIVERATSAPGLLTSTFQCFQSIALILFIKFSKSWARKNPAANLEDRLWSSLITTKETYEKNPMTSLYHPNFAKFTPFFVSNDRSSIIQRPQRPLFEISNISANIFSFSFWELNADW